MIAVLIIIKLLTDLFWDMEEVKEDMKCGKILDKGALCTFPIYDYDHNYDNNNNKINKKQQLNEEKGQKDH